VTDGAGRRFRLVLTTQAQRAEQYRKQAAAAKPAANSECCRHGYGADNGVRLAEVWLTRDPEYPDDLPHSRWRAILHPARRTGGGV
jgi:hypothetical protein